MIYTPIYKKDDYTFIVFTPDHDCKNRDDAFSQGCGFSLIEGMLCGFKFTGDIAEIDGGILHRSAELAGMRIGLLSGKLFEEAKHD